MSFYSEIIELLLLSCERYKTKEISLDTYKDHVWKGANQLLKLEMKEIREFLKSAEAELDSIQHTTDSREIFEATLPVIRRIEYKLHSIKNEKME